MQLEFKARASCVGEIMTNPRSKSEILSQTAKTYLEEWIKEKLYNRKKDIKSKYINKGNYLEDQSIEYYSFVKGYDFLLKNHDSFEDDFFTGTPDLIYDGVVYDFKNSWDCFTFPLFDADPPKGYVMQLQIYMHLLGVEEAKLVFLLMNTPEEISFKEQSNYDDVDPLLRIKEYQISYDPEFIESVKERVVLCRDYIKKLTESL